MAADMYILNSSAAILKITDDHHFVFAAYSFNLFEQHINYNDPADFYPVGPPYPLPEAWQPVGTWFET